MWLQMSMGATNNLAHQANLTSMANTNTRSFASLISGTTVFCQCTILAGTNGHMHKVDRWVLNEVPNSPRMKKHTIGKT